MRKLLAPLMALFLTLTTAFAAPPAPTTQNFYGPTHLKNSTYKSLAIYGPAQLENLRSESLSVMGPLEFTNLEVLKNAEIVGPVKSSEKGRFAILKVIGSFQAEQITADTLQIIGPSQLKEVIIKGESIIYGPLHASKSRLQNLTITAKEVELDNVSLSNIYVKKDGANEQTLVLDGNTTVTGNIIFESGKGRILLKSKDVVLKGGVRGAIVEK